MSESGKIRIQIEKYRAIQEAAIAINGITVVSGENGCGKSTLSKTLYYIFKTSSSYELLVAENLKEKLDGVLRFLDIAIRDIRVRSKERMLRNDLMKDLSNLTQRLDAQTPNEELLRDLLFQLDRINLIINLESKNDNSVSYRRLSFVANDLLNIKISPENSSEIPIEKIKNRTIEIFENAFKSLKSRNTSLLKKEFEKVFHTSELPKRLDVFEIDQNLLSLTNNILSVPYSIQNTIYIDTPMMLGEFSDDNPHWNDLNRLLYSNKYSNTNDAITRVIETEILKGDVKYDDDILSSYNFSFSRSEDGKVFNLFDCATGVKSFSILQMLLKLGHINSKTLLVFDEPESNLHPQWVVEYARMIVLINKIIGAKFFVASHNQDFISAIRYISEKENILDSVNFYLAVKDGVTYNYKHLGIEIDPIFESFNIALDRIEKYGI